MAQENDVRGRMSVEKLAGMVVGGLLILGLVGALAFWVFRDPMVALYSDLSEQDAASLVKALEQNEITYEVANGGKTVLVAQSQVDQAKLDVVTNGLQIQSGQGFELFDNTDFGMTEFAQKINYQRALQGELSRTLSGMPEVSYARVHITLPEDGLFAQNQKPAKASVSLHLKAGELVSARQIEGIQKMVASAVTGLEPHQVVVLDGKGVPLSRESIAGNPAAAMTDLTANGKTSLEERLQTKLSMLLDRAYGEEAAYVSVDVAFAMNKKTQTAEKMVPVTDPQGDIALMHRKQSTTTETNEQGGQGSDSRSTRVEESYAFSKHYEETVQFPGQIERITVAAIIRANVEADGQQQETADMIAAAIGMRPDRGDTVEVRFIPLTAGDASNDESPMVMTPNADAMVDAQSDNAAGGGFSPMRSQPRPEPFSLTFLERVDPWLLAGVWVVAGVLVLLLLMFAVESVRRRRDRNEALRDIEQWIGAEA